MAVHFPQRLGRHFKWNGISWVLLIAALLPLIAFSAINTVFNLKPGTTAGGCDNYFDRTAGTGPLRDIFDDSVAMNNAALQLIQAAQLNSQNNPTRVNEIQQAKRLVATFFGTERDHNEIEEWINDVGTLLGGNTQSLNYFLFCDATYETKMKSSAQAVLRDGSPAVDPNTNKAITIAQGFPGLNFRSFAPYLVDLSWHSPPEAFYVVDSKGFDPATYCSKADSLGRTQHGNNDIAVLLCPNSFTTGNGKAQNLRLGAQVNGNGQDINLVSCVAQTFYHELFHATQPRGTTLDNTGYGVRDIIDNSVKVLQSEQTGNANANKNTLQAPENYTWFALAAWYFYNQNIAFDAGMSQPRVPG